MGSKIVPSLQLALAMSIVGSSVVAGKMMTNALPVMLASCVRFAIASPVLIFVLIAREGPPQWPSRADLLTLFLQAFTGVFLFSALLLFGLQHSGAIEAGIITGTLPAVTAVLAVILLRERLHRSHIFGIACTVIGAALLNTLNHQSSSASPSSFLGYALIFAAVVCEALFAVLGKRTEGRVSALTIATAMSILGFVLFLPFALWDAYRFDFTRTTSMDWLLTAYFGLIVTVGAFWLFYAGLAKVPASVAGAFMAFLPLSAVILSNLILREPIRLPHIVGGMFVIGGIVWSALAHNGKSDHREAAAIGRSS